MRPWLDLAMANVDVDWAGAADAQEKVSFSIQSSLGNVAEIHLLWNCFVYMTMMRTPNDVRL